MENSFWQKKPIQLNFYKPDIIEKIYSNDEILFKTNIEINENKFKLDYTVYDNVNANPTENINYEKILNFINNNYVSSIDGTNKLLYTIDLLKFYCRNSIIIEFYPPNTKNIIGCIIGKKEQICLYSDITDIIEINFLCISSKLRKLNLGGYIINILVKEGIIHTNIGACYYTLSKQTNSKYYAKKKFYHRMININNLVNGKFINDENIDMYEYKKKFNKFLYKNSFKNNKVCYINNNLDLNSDLNKNLINELYTKLIDYNKKTYDIYESINIVEFTETFKNNDFHHFIIKNNTDTIINYVCMYRLDNYNTETNFRYTNGYLYYMFFDSSILDSLELIHEYIYTNKIFDLITFADIFNCDLSLINITHGSGLLYYHCANIIVSKMDNCKIGLITI
jgi:hypothetical protein